MTREELLKLPALRITDGGKTVRDFNTWGDLYTWTKGEGRRYNLTGRIMGDAAMVLLFGECPLRIDMKGKRELERLTPDLKWVRCAA